MTSTVFGYIKKKHCRKQSLAKTVWMKIAIYKSQNIVKPVALYNTIKYFVMNYYAFCQAVFDKWRSLIWNKDKKKSRKAVAYSPDSC